MVPIRSSQTGMTRHRSTQFGWRAAHMLILLILPLFASHSHASAQRSQSSWLEPSNLSLSSAASEPVILAQPEGTFRVFWWDRFDGITTVTGVPDAWSEPVAIPIVFIETLDRPLTDGTSFRFTPISLMPDIIADSTGGVHAIWLSEEVEEGTRARPLWYARFNDDAGEWSRPRLLAESAVSYKLIGGPGSSLHLVYLRDLYTEAQPAGLYYRKSADEGVSWTAPVSIHTSRYYRLVTAEQADLDAILSEDGVLLATWRDPGLKQTVLSKGTDEGSTWQTPVRVGISETDSRNGQFVPLPGSTSEDLSLLWESPTYATGCALYQASVDRLLGNNESGQQVLDQLSTCPDPRAAWFFPFGDTQTLMLAESEGSILTLIAWNGEQWSQTQRLQVEFLHPQTEEQVSLANLEVAQLMTSADPEDDGPGASDQPTLVLVGTDPTGDVWILTLAEEAVEAVFGPPPAWSEPTSLTQSSSLPVSPVMVADSEGSLHVLWSEQESPGRSRTVLRYTRLDGERWSRPAVVLRSPEGGARYPTLTASRDRLHVLWNGGHQGTIWYSSTFIRDAYASGAWLDPQLLAGSDQHPGTNTESYPHLVMAGDRLHAVYAVPINEQRGIYYTSSADAGTIWTPPVTVFDAVDAQWARVDYPRLAVDLQGGLHVVWLRPALTPEEPSQTVAYAWSQDNGKSWSSPQTIIEGAYAWPLITVNGLNQVHIVWQDIDQGTWWHRWLADAGNQPSNAENWAGWSRSEQLVGLRNVQEHVALMADGNGNLHLVGLRGNDGSSSTLVHTLWDGELWQQQESFVVGMKPAGVGMAATLQPENGRLDVLIGGAALAAGATPQVALWYTGRSVTPAAPIAIATARPEVTPTPEPAPTQSPVATATPDLGIGVPPAASGGLPVSMSVFLAGGLAALIVAGFFGTHLVLKRRR